MPLKGLNVLEFSGLAPVPFAGRILSDFGANVTVVQNVSIIYVIKYIFSVLVVNNILGIHQLYCGQSAF